MRSIATMPVLLLLLCILHVSALQSANVRVWDNVMEAPSRKLVHQIATESGLSHRLMIRDHEPKTPLEMSLEGILQELNDTSPFVEYWCRQEWRHIEAHADVDEYLAKTESSNFRFPTNGHVLYLLVGPQVRGPTCVFPGCSNGGDLAKESVSVISVPAVEGRLLRFPGHLLHAVPRPTHVWMLPFVQGSPDFSEDFQRSVVLFNTWNEKPPMQVSPLEASSCASAKSKFVNAFDHWEEREPISNSDLEPKQTKTKVWLLGDLKRRNNILRTVLVYSNGDQLRGALNEASQPRQTSLSQVADV